MQKYFWNLLGQTGMKENFYKKMFMWMSVLWTSVRKYSKWKKYLV